MDEIIANMDKQRERARIVAFVTDIAMMLRENGVIPCMSEVSTEIDDNDALKTLFCCRLEKLDFSEHDKVLEKKIAELENIINHKLGDWDKHGITYQEILDMKAENQELKQRIAELENENKNLNIRIFQNEAYGESKKTDKMHNSNCCKRDKRTRLC